MIAFAHLLLERLVFTPGRNAKIALLRRYFATQPERFLGTQPSYLNITNNISEGNTSGSTTSFTTGTNAVCTGNIGAGTTAAGC